MIGGINNWVSTVFKRENNGPIVYFYYSGSWNPIGGTNLSAIVPGSANHLTPSLTYIPGTTQMHVAWKKLIGSGSTPYDHLIVHRKSTNYYTRTC